MTQGHPNQSGGYAEYADRLLVALVYRSEGRSDLVDPEFDEVFRVCCDGIARSVRAQYPRLSSADVEDVVAETVSALIGAVEGGTEVRDPSGWLFIVARNKAADTTAAHARTVPTENPNPSPSPEPDDPDVAALIEALGDKSLVRAAIAKASASNDRTVLRVIVTWLELYERSGISPTLRTLGEEAEISHQGAADALRRFAGYVTEIEAGGS
jgi:DNA-directed RNA polymerase specialized sigma24 family protein